MIEPALYLLLVANATIATLVGDRITAGNIPQDQDVPCIYFGTDRIKPLPCRDPRGAFSGTLEVGFQAKSYHEIEALTKAVRAVLDAYSGVTEGVSLSINTGSTTPDDFDDTLRLYTRALEFSVNGQVLN